MTVTPTADPAAAFQYVPVPNEHVSAVYTLLARLASPTAAADAPEPSPAADVAPNAVDGWTDENLTKFLAMDTKTSVIVDRMLRHLAETPGQDYALSTRELAGALNVNYSTMKIIPTQVARTLGKHFPGLTPPWSYLSGPKFQQPRPNEVYFWVTSERAAQLKSLRG